MSQVKKMSRIKLLTHPTPIRYRIKISTFNPTRPSVEVSHISVHPLLLGLVLFEPSLKVHDDRLCFF